MIQQPVTASIAQRKIFDGVIAFIAKQGYAPRPIQLQRFMDDLGVTMTWRHMRALEQSGALVKEGGTYRPNRGSLAHYSRGFGDAAQHYRGRLRESMAEHGIPVATTDSILTVFDDEIPEEPSNEAPDPNA